MQAVKYHFIRIKMTFISSFDSFHLLQNMTIEMLCSQNVQSLGKRKKEHVTLQMEHESEERKCGRKQVLIKCGGGVKQKTK